MFLLVILANIFFFNDSSQAEIDTEIKTDSWNPTESKILLTTLQSSFENSLIITDISKSTQEFCSVI